MSKEPVELKMVTLVSEGTRTLGTFSESHKIGLDRANGDLEEREKFLPDGTSSALDSPFTDHEGKISFGMSVFNLANAIMGSGILGLAYAMANTGIILFVCLLVSVALLSVYSIHLLLKTAGVVGIRAYEQLGFRAFGIPGKLAAGFAITLQNIGAMSSYLYIIKSELPTVIKTLSDSDEGSAWYLNGDYLLVMVTILVILPLTLMKNIGYLGYTSGFSLMCMVFFLCAVIYKKFQISCPDSNGYHYDVNVTSLSTKIPSISPLHTNNNSHEDTCSPHYITVSTKTAYTIPILAFAFVCHPEVLPIYTELTNPTKERMQSVANLSVFSMFFMYLLTAIFGYLTFYGRVEDELLHTYPHHDQLILAVRLAVLVAVTLTVPIVHFPVRKAILQMACPDKPFNWLRHALIAVVLLAGICLLVIFVPNIRDIFGFVGSTSAPCLIFIFPAIFYIRNVPMEREPLNSRQKIGAACFGLLGVAFMVMSISLIITDWVAGETGHGGGH
uniref:Solute carrier family 38 member 3b n=1 Tax=Eptatretus burgeri TaxID=7764 RepID=A0A8C4Q0M5_EPTBU